MDKDIVGYTVEYYPIMIKKDILPFVTKWIDLEHIMLSEVSQKNKYWCDITYMWTLKSQTH